MSTLSARFSGLAGTVLLGSLLGLTYSQWLARTYPLLRRGGAGHYEDEEGRTVDFEDLPLEVKRSLTHSLPGKAWVEGVKGRLGRLPGEVHPLYLICGLLTLAWGAKSSVAMHRLLTRRYADSVYQIRRPDVIADRMRAFRIFGLGALVVPLGVAGSVWALPVGDGSAVREGAEWLGESLALSAVGRGGLEAFKPRWKMTDLEAAAHSVLSRDS